MQRNLFDRDGAVIVHIFDIFAVEPVPDFVLRVSEFHELATVDNVDRRRRRALKRRLVDIIDVTTVNAVIKAVGHPGWRFDKETGFFVRESVFVTTQNNVGKRCVIFSVAFGR